MTFKAGQSGNIHGRPPGAKNKRTIRVELQEWFEEAVEGIKEQGWENPLSIIAMIANDERNGPEIQLKAASKLADILVPTLPKELIVTQEEAPLDPEQTQLRLAQIYLLLQQLQPVITDERTIDSQ